MDEKDSKMAAHFERVINNLNQHWHSIELLLSHVSQPLVVDDRGLAAAFNAIREQVERLRHFLNETTEQLKCLDLSQTFGEIKYIGARLKQIESDIAEIKEGGIKQKLDFNISVDGYELVKPKPKNSEGLTEEKAIKELIDTLTPRESKVLCLTFGLLGHKKRTLSACESEIGVGRERIRQIKLKALRKCRHSSRRSLVDRITHAELKREITGAEK